MKQIFFAITLFLFGFSQAQQMRAKNIGLVCAYNFGKKNQQIPSFQIALTKQIGKYLLPEIGLRFENKTPFSNLTSYTAALQFRKSLFKLRVLNQSGICKAEVLECFVTPEYQYSIDVSRLSPQNQFAFRYGISLYHLKSSNSRNSKSWVTKMEVYNRTIFSTKQNEMGIALRVQCFRKRGW